MTGAQTPCGADTQRNDAAARRRGRVARFVVRAQRAAHTHTRPHKRASTTGPFYHLKRLVAGEGLEPPTLGL